MEETVKAQIYNKKKLTFFLILFFLLIIFVFYNNKPNYFNKNMEIEMTFNEDVPALIYGYLYDTENEKSFSAITLENTQNVNNKSDISAKFNVFLENKEDYIKLTEDKNIAIGLRNENTVLPHSFKYIYYNKGEKNKIYFIFNNSVIFNEFENKTEVSYMYERFK